VISYTLLGNTYRFLRVLPTFYNGWKSLRTCITTVNAPAAIAPPAFVVGSDTCGGVYSGATVFPGYASCDPNNAKINQAPGGYCPISPGTLTDFLQIDLGTNLDLLAIYFQGRSEYGQWVTSFYVNISNDGHTTTPLGGLFRGNNDSTTVRSYAISGNTRYLRVIPIGYNGWSSFRTCVKTATPTPPKVTLPPPPTKNGLNGGAYICPGVYSAPTQFPEADCNAVLAVVGYNGAYCPVTPTLGPTIYLQIDLGVAQSITAISTQGRQTYPQWVWSYYLQISNTTNDSDFIQFGGLFLGNKDQTTIQTNPVGVAARVVRIYPAGSYGWPSFRACLVVSS